MDSLSAAILWLYQWQTLAGGLVALFAAGIGWCAVRRQIRASDEQEEKRRVRQFIAERASLPHTLHRVTAYANQCLDYSENLLARIFDPADRHEFSEWFRLGGLSPEPPPLLPQDVIAELKSCLASADGDISNRLWIFLADLQVQQSRLKSLPEQVKASSTIEYVRQLLEDSFGDAAVVKAHADNLYRFARFQDEVEPPPLTWDKVDNTIAQRSGPAIGGAIARLNERRKFDDDPRLVK